MSGSSPTAATLGFLYPQSSASWVVESFTQFKLGVRQVNAAGLGVNLSYKVFNSQGESLTAMQGAAALLDDPDIVGLVGTGYSAAAQGAATFASFRQKPMITPGASSIALVDKTQIPYFMRIIPSDAQQMTAMATVVHRFGWRNVAVVHSKTFLSQADFFTAQVP